jgi:ABC-type polysaccharide/polyol phosphate transport system ATPase subunit
VRIQEFLSRGATLLLVSHAPQSMLKLCQRAIWVHEGRIVADGRASDVVGAFVDHAIPPQPQSALGGAGRA